EKYLQPVGPVGSKTRLLQKSALIAAYDTIQYSRASFALLDNTDQHLLFHSNANHLNSAASNTICNDNATKRLIIQSNDVPDTRVRVFKYGDKKSAIDYANSIGYPVVVKPAMGTIGIGVRAGIQNQEEFEEALKYTSSSRLGKQDVIVEQHIF